MISNDDNLSSFKNITNISVKTNTKILPKNLNSFILNSLKLNNINLSDNDKIFYSFINEIYSYEIYILNTKQKNPKTQYHIFTSYYKLNKIDEKNNIDIFICEEFFCVYKNQKFYFAKDNKDYAIEDIIKYLEFKYKLGINNIKIINKKLFQTYTNHLFEDKDFKIDFINTKRTNNHIYFIVYIIIFFILAYLFLDKKNENLNDKNDVKQLININQIQNNNKINTLIYNLNIHNIYVDKISFNKYYSLNLNSKKISNLYNFVNKYHNKINIKSLYLSKKIYVMEVEIEL